jgi:hypothetical protein
MKKSTKGAIAIIISIAAFYGIMMTLLGTPFWGY